MRLENQDPRRVLCETKYFGLRPQPLEQHLYRMNLPRCAERVFWLHWDMGYRSGDFTSEIAISEVARRVGCDTSSVTRAYQRLKQVGLLRRQDPGRDPSNPFQQATAVTEVLLPRQALGELLGAPDRRVGSQSSAHKLESARPSSAPAIEEPAAAAETINPSPEDEIRCQVQQRHGHRAMAKILARMGVEERQRFWRAQRDHLAEMQFDLGTQLDAVECAWLQLQLKALNPPQIEAPQPSGRCAATPAKASRRRMLDPFSLAYLRKHLQKTVGSADVEQRFREVVWSVEEGALQKFEVRLGLNIALKKLREGVWTRPNRMPPNWRRAVA